MKRFFCLIFVFSLTFFLLTSGTGLAATWYVSDTDGSDSDPGTQSQPFATIQQAVDTAGNGDTILVEEGTYIEDVIVDKDGLTLRSMVSAGATIDGVNFGIQLTGNGLTVEDFTIEDSTHGIVVSEDQTEDITFSSNWFSGISEDGIYFPFETALEGCNVRIEDNIIFSSGTGIYMEGDMGILQDVDIMILDNYVDGPSYGVFFNYLSGGSVEISDNSIIDCNSSGIYVDTINPSGNEISFKIENNKIDFSGTNGSSGIYMYNAERTTWIKGNTITGDYDDGIYINVLGNYGETPLQVYIDGNEIGECDNGIYIYQLFEDFTGSIYLRDNTIYQCLDGMYLEFVGDDSDAEDFRLYIENNYISYCSGRALYFDEVFYQTTGEIYVRGNTFVENNSGLEVNSENYLGESIFVLENNNLQNNLFYGMENNTDELISAPNNWWGDPSGPYDPEDMEDDPEYDNPVGLGDTVTEFIDYKPWRQTPYIPGEDSSDGGGGCNAGGSLPGLVLLILPLLALGRFRKNI